MARYGPIRTRSRRAATGALLLVAYLFVSPLPGRAETAGTWKSISVGGYHVCAIAKDDSAWCWGGNSDGPIGDGTSANRLSPTRVLTDGALPDTYKAISAGTNHTCAIAMDDTAWCWGSDGFGGLGDGDGSPLSELSPVPVKTGAGLSATYERIDAGYFATCAIASDDTAWCWGYNLRGQLGNGTTTPSDVPIAVSTGGALPSAYAAISMGGFHTCALAGDGSAWCWGDNVKLQLGMISGGPLRSLVPAAVETVSPSGPDVLPDAYAAITAGHDHGCALTAGDVAWCWGEGLDGEVGTGSWNGSDVPTTVDTSSGRPLTYSEIDGGGWFTCGIDAETGSPWCWGDDGQGQLGNGPQGDQNAPAAVLVAPASSPYHGLSAGDYSACALASDDTAWCWGIFDTVPYQVMGGVTGANCTTGSPSSACHVVTYEILSARSIALDSTATIEFGAVRQGRQVDRDGPDIYYATTWAGDAISVDSSVASQTGIRLLFDVLSIADPLVADCTASGTDLTDPDPVELTTTPTMVISGIEDCGGAAATDGNSGATATTRLSVDATGASDAGTDYTAPVVTTVTYTIEGS